MAELAGAAAVLVRPGDAEDLARGIEEVLAGPAAVSRAERRALGLSVAAARTWAASAEKHLAAYRRAAEQGPG
jgi:glycosyltransferase involved in cell wall biosynthesis